MRLLILEDDPFREQEFRRLLGHHSTEAVILADSPVFGRTYSEKHETIKVPGDLPRS